MIGYLKGNILAKSPDSHQCIIEAGNVGYEVNVPARLFDSLVVGESAALWIHTHVREDLLVLYGFANEAEKQFFRLLLSVSGLGPKTALSLLSEHGAQRLPQLVLAKEADEIATAPGVGKKLAQRLTLELASKLEKLAWVTTLQKVSDTHRPVIFSPERQLREDLSSALANLGYQPQPIKAALDRLFDRAGNETLGFEACLKQALVELSGRPGRANSASSQETLSHG